MLQRNRFEIKNAPILLETGRARRIYGIFLFAKVAVVLRLTDGQHFLQAHGVQLVYAFLSCRREPLGPVRGSVSLLLPV